MQLGRVAQTPQTYQISGDAVVNSSGNDTDAGVGAKHARHGLEEGAHSELIGIGHGLSAVDDENLARARGGGLADRTDDTGEDTYHIARQGAAS